MKRILLLITLLFPLALCAQKYACVNTEYILSNIPDYSRAQSQLDKMAANWQKELEQKFQEIDRLYKTYQQEAYLLPDNLKRKREDELKAKEAEARELQNMPRNSSTPYTPPSTGLNALATATMGSCVPAAGR